MIGCTVVVTWSPVNNPDYPALGSIGEAVSDLDWNGYFDVIFPEYEHVHRTHISQIIVYPHDSKSGRVATCIANMQGNSWALLDSL